MGATNEMASTSPCECCSRVFSTSFRILCIECTLVFTEREEFNKHYEEKHNQVTDQNTGDKPYCHLCSRSLDVDISSHFFAEHGVELKRAPAVIENKKEIKIFLNNVVKDEDEFDDHADAMNKVKVEMDPDSVPLGDLDDFDYGSYDSFEDLSGDWMKGEAEAGEVRAERSRKCAICDKVFKSRKMLKIHMLNAHQDDELGFKPKLASKCKYCTFVYGHRLEYQRHMMDLHKESVSSHVCNECDKFYTNPKDLKEHKISVHENEVPPCTICGKKVTPRSMKQHMENVHSEHPVECKICGKILKNPNSLRSHHKEAHVKIKGRKLENQCRYCNFIYEDRDSFQNHIATDHVYLLPNHQCSICHKFYSHPIYLKHHNRDVHENKAIPCEVCGKDIPGKKRLAEHMRNVHGNENLPCDVCGQTFKNSRYLDEHCLRVHARRRGQPDQCAYCDFIYEGDSSFQDHLQMSHADKLAEHQCHQCGKIFAMPNSVKKHILSVHTGETHYCDICGKTFGNTMNLRRHINMVHRKAEQPQIKCEQCDYTHPLKSAILKHKRAVHDKLKNFVCSSCGKCFSSQGNLDKHVKVIHIKIKDQICPHCGMAFCLREGLQKHIKHVHQGFKKIKCPACVRHFTTEANLKNHLLAGCDGKKRKSRVKVPKY